MRRIADKEGFTLVELLIVVVIIGILAAIAIPKFGSTKEKAFLTTMKSDLRNLVTAQDAYLADTQTYYGGPVPNPAFAYNASSSVTVTIVATAPGGWQGAAAHSATGRTCAIFYGNIAPLAPATVSGEPRCT